MYSKMMIRLVYGTTYFYSLSASFSVPNLSLAGKCGHDDYFT
jgi:hypothetical protein